MCILVSMRVRGLLFGTTSRKIHLSWTTPQTLGYWHYIKRMRVRTKDCYKCDEPKEVLYRCRYKDLQEWIFLCGECLQKVKAEFEISYQYGGTWKAKKK